MVQLCVAGMRAEAEGQLDTARARFAEAWTSQRNDLEACAPAASAATIQWYSQAK